jgi:hypothetical protein
MFRIRNKGHLKAVDIVPAQHKKLIRILYSAELAQTAAGDVANGTLKCEIADAR